MRKVRERLAAVAALLLLLQAAALSVWPLKACCPAPQQSAVMDCCRGGANGHICAMKTKGGNRCRLRAACASESVGVLTAAAWFGLVPDGIAIDRDVTMAAVSWPPAPVVLPWIQPPPTPPPRG
jgi:hypothetical protein